MTGQVDLEKDKNDTVAQVVEMFLEFAKGDIKKQTHNSTLTNGTIVYSYVCQINHELE